MSNPKELRKSLRNVVQELYPEIITKELEDALFKALEIRVKKLEEDVRKQMHEMNERHKDVMGFLVRNVSQKV